jgi:hypothetical protein
MNAAGNGFTTPNAASPLPEETRPETHPPHAYQAASYEHELGSEVPTRLPFTNILLSMSRI